MGEKKKAPVPFPPIREQRQVPVHLTLCVPSHDRVHAVFAFDLARMMGRLGYGPVAQGVMDVSIKTVQGTVITDARNQMVRDALKEGAATHLLFLDADMRIPWDAPLRLLAHNLPLVGCNYSTRKGNPRPVAFRDTSAPADKPYDRFLFPGEQDPPLIEVDAIGFGCTLIHADVFRAMKFPWFDMVYDEHGSLTGEDVYFCRKARELGVPTYVDTALSRELGHVGDREYTLLDVESIAEDIYGAAKPSIILAE